MAKRYTYEVKKISYEVTPDDLRAIRKDEARATQAEFADMLGLSVISIKKIEAGDQLPSIYVLADIAERFGISFEINPERKHPLLKAKRDDSTEAA